MAMEHSLESAILEDIFNILPASVSCDVSLTEKFLLMEFSNKSKSENEKIHISDMLGCRILKDKNKVKSEIKDECAYLTVYAYPLKTISGILSRHQRRERRAITFQMSKFDTLDKNLKVVNQWHRAIACLIRGYSCVRNGALVIPDELLPPRKILILVNPKSGPGKAYQVFKERVVPLFSETDLEYDLLVTDRANCARDYVKKADLSQWHGIVVVSGDGLLFEVYNGLMSRPDWKDVIKIPVGVIPGGSGNGLARALSHANNEPYDVNVVTPSVLNIIHGKVVPMDLVKVQTEKGSFYSFLSVGWGLMADIDIESERLRAIGEARFTVWGFVRVIGLRRYRGRLAYLPVSGYEPNSKPKVPVEPRPKRSKTIDCHLAWSDDSGHVEDGGEDHTIFRSKSFGAHNPSLDDDNDVRLLKFSYSVDSLDADCDESFFKSGEGDSNIKKKVPHDHCQKNENEAEEEEEEEEKVQHATVAHSYCPPLSSPVPEDWIVVDDEFVLVYACHQTHLSTDVYFAPEAKMDDGIMWLVMIKGNVTKLQVMYFLASLQSGDHVHIPYVDVIPIHAFRLEPHTSEGFMTVDGEVISCSTVQAEVLPSIGRVMSR